MEIDIDEPQEAALANAPIGGLYRNKATNPLKEKNCAIRKKMQPYSSEASGRHQRGFTCKSHAAESRRNSKAFLGAHQQTRGDPS